MLSWVSLFPIALPLSINVNSCNLLFSSFPMQDSVRLFRDILPHPPPDALHNLLLSPAVTRETQRQRSFPPPHPRGEIHSSRTLQAAEPGHVSTERKKKRADHCQLHWPRALQDGHCLLVGERAFPVDPLQLRIRRTILVRILVCFPCFPWLPDQRESEFIPPHKHLHIYLGTSPSSPDSFPSSQHKQSLPVV
jgi:hypothetical protein